MLLAAERLRVQQRAAAVRAAAAGLVGHVCTNRLAWITVGTRRAAEAVIEAIRNGIASPRVGGAGHENTRHSTAAIQAMTGIASAHRNVCSPRWSGSGGSGCCRVRWVSAIAVIVLGSVQ